MEIEVIYEKGVFKPLQKVDLKEGTRVTFIMGKDRVRKILQNLKTLELVDGETEDIFRLNQKYSLQTLCQE